jgi:hypothetical protein
MNIGRCGEFLSPDFEIITAHPLRRSEDQHSTAVFIRAYQDLVDSSRQNPYSQDWVAAIMI